MYDYKAKLIKVIDGDTIKCDIDLGFNMWMRNVNVRLAGLNTPEIRTKDPVEKMKGYEAKEFVEECFEKSSEFEIEVLKLGKYGRPIANVFLMTEDGQVILNELLINEGLAEEKEY